MVRKKEAILPDKKETPRGHKPLAQGTYLLSGSMREATFSNRAQHRGKRVSEP
jgi:hypothetical protein